MGIKPRNLHRKHFPHPNVVMVPIVRAAADTGRFLASTVLSTITTNAPITLLKPWVPGSAVNARIQVNQAASEGAPTVTWRVRGKDQFGKPREDTNTVAAFAAQSTNGVYSEVDEIVITSSTAGLTSLVRFETGGSSAMRNAGNFYIKFNFGAEANP